MSKPKIIRSTDQLIEAMGGMGATASWAGITLPAIYQWRDCGIPQRWHYRLAVYLERSGIAFDPVALGWLSEPHIESVNG